MIPSMVPLLLQVSMSNRLASNDHAHVYSSCFPGDTLSGLDDGSSTVFPRLLVSELQVSGSTPRFTERPESPDFSSNTGFSATAMLAISSSVRPANRALFQRSFEERSTLTRLRRRCLLGNPPRLTNSRSHRNCRHRREYHTPASDAVMSKQHSRQPCSNLPQASHARIPSNAQRQPTGENNRDMCHDYTNVVHSKQLLSCAYSTV